MYAYILDNMDLTVKDVLQFEAGSFRWDLDFDNKSSITVSGKPEIADDDFVVCKSENDTVYMGICENCTATSDKEVYTISLLQMEQLFSRHIFVGDESVIADTGIEDFIAGEIRDNFIAFGDEWTDKSYITVQVMTHTPLAVGVDSDNGVYDLKSFLSSARQYYGIRLDFVFNGSYLQIKIRREGTEQFPIDTGVSDITDYEEIYEVAVLAKLIVRWKVPDTQDSVGEQTMRTFYLREDQTITEEASDESRAKGSIRSLYVEAKTEEEMLQRVANEFAENTYNHKISFKLRRGSQCYPEEELYIGRTCRIKTGVGVRSSMVAEVKKDSDSDVVSVTMGRLKVTLIEKLRRR